MLRIMLPSYWNPHDTSGIKPLFASSYLAICSSLSLAFLLALNTIQLLCRIHAITSSTQPPPLLPLPPSVLGPLKLLPFTKVYL